MKDSRVVQMLIKLTTLAAAGVSAAASRLLMQSEETAEKGRLLLLISVVIIAVLFIEYAYFGSSAKKYIARSINLLKRTEKLSMENLPAPAVAVDEDNCIVWYNKLFGEKVMTGEDMLGADLTEVFDIDMDKIFSKNGDTMYHEGRFYSVRAVKTSDDSDEMTMLYFQDNTRLAELENDKRESQQSVIIISIDNYEELIQNIRESEKAHILVSIERLIEEFTEGTTGISRRAGNDRFYVILEERYLRPIIEKRFEILEKARTIMINERTGLTLSIGVGHEAKNLAESEKYAKKALEMCFGRGGDQAAVRTDGSYEFYGGVSKSVSKNTRVRSRMVAGALMELINSADTVLIMGHRFGDLDSIGASTGLCDAINALGKECFVVVDKNENLSKLMINYVSENLTRNYYISPEEGVSRVNDDSLLIICDTHNPSLVESPGVLENSKHIVVIDHHRLIVKPIDNTDLFYHEQSASSACEMVAELLEYFPDVHTPPYVAEALLAGIMLDTKSFVMNTGVRTFEAAAFLKKAGADTVAVKKLFANPLETYICKADMIDNAEIYRGCAVAASETPSDNIRIAASKAADEMLEIKDVRASFVLFPACGAINISARSMGGCNVQLIMEKLGGGGHHTMAACQLKGETLEGAKKRLISVIDEYMDSTTV